MNKKNSQQDNPRGWNAFTEPIMRLNYGSSGYILQITAEVYRRFDIYPVTNVRFFSVREDLYLAINSDHKESIKAYQGKFNSCAISNKLLVREVLQFFNIEPGENEKHSFLLNRKEDYNGIGFLFQITYKSPDNKQKSTDMKNQIEIIKTEEVLGKVLHVYGTPENPLFIAVDVAAWIEHANPTLMVNNIDDNEKLTYTIHRAGQNRSMLMLTEFGIYEVLFQSRKPIAKAFKKEVKRILKELRVHGVTATDDMTERILADPDFAIKTFQALKEVRAAREIAEKKALEEKIRADLNEQKLCLANRQIQENKPKAEFCDNVSKSGNAILVREYAKIISGGGFEIGEHRLYNWFRDNGYLNDNNEPYQQFITMGVFIVIERTYESSGGTFTSFTTKITGKGQTYFAGKIRPSNNKLF